MKISFVIPAYNEEAVIGQCLDSVRKEIARSGRVAEIIVANNNSTDHTKEIAASRLDVHVVDETRKGTNWARQAGFLASSGDLIANIDADSQLPAGWLDIVYAAFEKNEKLVGLSGPYIHNDLSGWTYVFVQFTQFTVFLGYLINRFILRTGSQLLGGNCVMRRSALEQIGGYNTALTFYGDDIDTARRLSKIGTVKFTYKLRVYSSGRRYAQQGIAKTIWLYLKNFVSGYYTHAAPTTTHADARASSSER